MSATITYVHHNCFCLELAGQVLLFDFPAAAHRPEAASGLVASRLAGADVTVFFSHSHDDHCGADIIELARGAADLRYVLSYDVPELIDALDLPGAVVLDPDEGEQTAGELRVSCLESTDLGVGFLIRHSGTGSRIYFGGDLAEWTWESLDERARVAEESYFQECLAEIRDFRPQVAFTNADPRFPSRGGARRFAETVAPPVLVPMHLFGDTSLMSELERDLAQPGVTLFGYREMGDELVVEL